MLMLLGTTTVCRVACEDAAGPVVRVRVSHGCPVRAAFRSGFERLHVTGAGGRARAHRQGRVTVQDAQAHLVGGALAPHDVPVGLALERRQLVAQPLDVPAGDLDGVDRRRACTGLIGLAALVVEVPDRDVEEGPRPRRAGVDLDLDRAAEQVHVAGDAADRRRLGRSVRVHDVHLAGARLAAAEEVEQVVGDARPVAEPRLDVGDAASRSHSGPSVVPARQGSSTGAGSSIVSSGVSSARAGRQPELGGRLRRARRRRAGCSGPA